MAKQQQSKQSNGKSSTTTLAPTTPVTVATALLDTAALIVEPITTKSLEGVNIERIVSLDSGQMVRGKYLGLGAKAEVSDPVTGEVREIDTHRIEAAGHPGVVARIFDSHQLARELLDKVGKEVRIMKLGQVSTKKGRRVNDYIVAVEQ